jgi:thiamine kinase-like enzyme
MVSSHNDLKPENTLFDGDRVWLVDWEAAFLNDRYHDLATVENFVVTNDAEEEAHLRAYFGEPGLAEYARGAIRESTTNRLRSTCRRIAPGVRPAFRIGKTY